METIFILRQVALEQALEDNGLRIREVKVEYKVFK